MIKILTYYIAYFDIFGTKTQFPNSNKSIATIMCSSMQIRDVYVRVQIGFCVFVWFVFGSCIFFCVRVLVFVFVYFYLCLCTSTCVCVLLFVFVYFYLCLCTSICVLCICICVRVLLLVFCIFLLVFSVFLLVFVYCTSGPPYFPLLTVRHIFEISGRSTHEPK